MLNLLHLESPFPFFVKTDSNITFNKDVFPQGSDPTSENYFFLNTQSVQCLLMHIFLPGGPISPGSPGNPNPSWPRSPLGPLYPEDRGDTLAENKKNTRQSAVLQLVRLVQIPEEQSPLNFNISPGTCIETTSLFIRYSVVKMSAFSSALVLSRSECRDGSLLLSSFDPSLLWTEPHTDI